LSCPARFGIAAPDAGMNKASDSDANKARPSSKAGVSATTAMLAQHPAAPSSARIITRRRSNRSLIAPATGPKNPTTPSVRIIVAATHPVDRVCR
jgi:hypothetical protein